MKSCNTYFMTNSKMDENIKKITELLVKEMEVFHYGFSDFNKKYQLIKEINKDLSVYPRDTVKNIIKDLEDKGIVEHLNIDLLQPKKSNVVTAYKKDDVIWVYGGELIPLIPSPQISTHKIFLRSIDNMLEEEAYYNIIDRLFPMVCNCELHCNYDVNGNVMFIDSVRNILKLIGAKSVEVNIKRGAIFFQLSRKRIKYWFGGSLSKTNPLSNGESLLKGLKIIKHSESIVELLHVIRVYNEKSNPLVVFEITEIGDPGSFYGFTINSAEYEEKIFEILEEYASKYKCNLVIKNEQKNTNENVKK